MTKFNYYFTEQRNKYPDPTVLGFFTGNHDNARFLYPPEGRAYVLGRKTRYLLWR